MIPQPTEKELDILQVLWAKGPQTVREVNDQLRSEKEIGYTTTLKILQIMHDKGLVSRELKGKTHIYKSIISESATQQKMLDKVVDKVFKGSAMNLVMQALGNSKSTDKELDEIRAYIDQLKNDKND
ncbi:BlaI/MecI/CopY family transcriptional regulator [Fulvivirga lutimaris]|uniref:BlaI/MecI/CopY family transcriptional regulator n=1 Tax=Fulvivirga lutimaris TaxID=1819566 RepID=UPI0012BC8926|nr:BlaI/MecI/CopY family transcriptional regulator [Fulvivirga lutimaris]MTI41439.1 BlaI/MecI/CopY family transcriptional regulator [Fulvivirga lutimaris]